MITKITIENFKGISLPVEIELKPITLLFGSNSAGKSTIFHAFLYAYEVFVNRNFNPDRTTLGGDSVDLGGFETFVHQHELDRSIRLGFELNMSSAQLDIEWPIAETLISSGTSSIDLSSLGSDVWKSEIDVCIGWDKGAKRPFVMAYKVNLDGEQIIALECEHPQKGVYAKINYRHHVFLWAGSLDLEIEESIGVLDYLFPMIRTVSDKRFWEEGIEVDIEIFDTTPELTLGNPPTADAPDLGSYRVFEELEEGWKAVFFYLLDEEKSKATLQGVFFFGTSKWNESQARERWELYQNLDELDDSFRIKLNGLNDALPIPGRSLEIPIGPSESTEYRFVIDLLSRLSIAPLQVLMRELSEMRHIGPLRKIPQRNFRPAMSPDRSRWSSGLAAWDFLDNANEKFIDRISDWLSDSDRLGTGYEIVRKRFRELPSDDYIMRILEQENPLDDLQIAVEGIKQLPEKKRIVLRDINTLVDVEPQDIAVGLTQLIPVLVAAFDFKGGMALIEQPEIHNHPSVEVGLGDVFIETIDEIMSCRFILETHGEHLMLRMLRRIRETHDRELPEGKKALLSSQIAVYYVERTPDGVVVKHLAIDSTGEFIDRWPNGFFRERAKELF